MFARLTQTAVVMEDVLRAPAFALPDSQAPTARSRHVVLEMSALVMGCARTFNVCVRTGFRGQLATRKDVPRIALAMGGASKELVSVTAVLLARIVRLQFARMHATIMDNATEGCANVSAVGQGSTVQLACAKMIAQVMGDASMGHAFVTMEERGPIAPKPLAATIALGTECALKTNATAELVGLAACVTLEAA